MSDSPTALSKSRPAVLFLGQSGHGRTFLIQKLRTTALGTTLSLQNAPAFAPKNAQQLKESLEEGELSGIFLVVRSGRADEMAHVVTQMMDFIDADDGIRIIATFEDIVRDQDGYDWSETRNHLSGLLSVDMDHIYSVGEDTSAEEVHAFVCGTLHKSRTYEINDMQVKALSTREVQIRGCHLKSHEVKSPTMKASAKMEVRKRRCEEIMPSEGIDPKCTSYIENRATPLNRIDPVGSCRESLIEVGTAQSTSDSFSFVPASRDQRFRGSRNASLINDFGEKNFDVDVAMSTSTSTNAGSAVSTNAEQMTFVADTAESPEGYGFLMPPCCSFNCLCGIGLICCACAILICQLPVAPKFSDDL